MRYWRITYLPSSQIARVIEEVFQAETENELDKYLYNEHACDLCKQEYADFWLTNCSCEFTVEEVDNQGEPIKDE